MSAEILSVAAVTDNFPDGQKITAAKVQFDCDVSSCVHPEQFRVAGKMLIGSRTEGDTAILELEPTGLIPPAPKPPKGAGGPPPQHKGPPNLPPAVRLPVEVTVTFDEVGYASDRTEEPIVEDFQQFQLNGMWYNLYIPKLEEGRCYPLVLFIHDAGACGADSKITLSQGYGAIGFAAPQWQEKYPCFVLAPQVDKYPYGPMTHDDFTVTEDFDRVKAILDYVLKHYPVDRKRVYTTGQSMGCMASCEMNIRYPDLFAASLLVAGQWSPEKMAASCPQNNFWILVSEGDRKAYPGMTAVTDAMEKAGATVLRSRWDGTKRPEELTALAYEEMEKQGNVRFTVFEGSSVLRDFSDPNPGAHHMATWPIAYSIDGLKEWLFSNAK